MKDKKRIGYSLIALMFATVMNGTNTSITIVLAEFANKFHSISLTTIYQLATAPSLLTLGISLLFGPLVGRKIKYKTTILIGLTVCLISGVAPYFYLENFWFLYVCRLIYGVGVAFITFYNAGFLYMLGSEKGSRYVALAGTLGSIVTIIFQNLTGFLLKISLNATFLIELYGLFAIIIFAILFKEPKKDEAENTDSVVENQEASVTKTKNRLPIIVFVYILSYFVLFTIMYPLALSISTMVAIKGFGTATVAGLILSFFTAGGVVSGPLFGKLNSLFKRYTVAFIFILIAGSFTIVSLTSSMILYCIAYFMMGFALLFLGPLLFLYCGTIVSKENLAFLSSLVMAAAMLAVFASNYWITLASKIFGGGDLIMAPIRVGMAIFVILTVGLLIIDPRPKELR